MVLTEDQKQVKALLTETITLLCKNGLHFRSEFSIDGLIGITLDQDNVFLVSIKETIKCDSSQNNDLVHISQTKTESVSRMSPSQSRGKKHARTNEAVTADKTSATSQSRVNYPSATVEESGFATRSEMPDVKLEFGTTDTQDHSRLEFEDPSVTEELFSGGAMTSSTRHSRTDVSRNNSDANVQKDAAVSRHCESLEPSHKRLRTGDHTKTNESPADDDRTAEFHDNVAPGSRVCKTEPLDVVEIPDDEMESSLNSDNSYLMYMSMYGSGADGGAVSTDAAYSAQYDMSQMNQHSNVAGCSSWSTTQRNSNVFNNQDKVELIEGSSVFISSSLYRELEQEVSPKASRLVRRLVHEIFPDERTLASSSCLGKRQSCCRGLDQTKVDAIKEYVLSRTPQMTHTDFVQTINIMCADARKAIRARYHRQLLAEHSKYANE